MGAPRKNACVPRFGEVPPDVKRAVPEATWPENPRSASSGRSSSSSRTDRPTGFADKVGIGQAAEAGQRHATALCLRRDELEPQRRREVLEQGKPVPHGNWLQNQSVLVYES